MPTELETALQALEPTAHAEAWALVRAAELTVPAVLERTRGARSGNFLKIQHGALTVVLAFTSGAKIGGFRTQAKQVLRMTGAELAEAIPADAAIGLNLGQPDARLFLPEVLQGE